MARSSRKRRGGREPSRASSASSPGSAVALKPGEDPSAEPAAPALAVETLAADPDLTQGGAFVWPPPADELELAHAALLERQARRARRRQASSDPRFTAPATSASASELEDAPGAATESLPEHALDLRPAVADDFDGAPLAGADHDADFATHGDRDDSAEREADALLAEVQQLLANESAETHPEALAEGVVPTVASAPWRSAAPFVVPDEPVAAPAPAQPEAEDGSRIDRAAGDLPPTPEIQSAANDAPDTDLEMAAEDESLVAPPPPPGPDQRLVAAVGLLGAATLITVAIGAFLWNQYDQSPFGLPPGTKIDDPLAERRSPSAFSTPTPATGEAPPLPADSARAPAAPTDSRSPAPLPSAGEPRPPAATPGAPPAPAATPAEGRALPSAAPTPEGWPAPNVLPASPPPPRADAPSDASRTAVPVPPPATRVETPAPAAAVPPVVAEPRREVPAAPSISVADDPAVVLTPEPPLVPPPAPVTAPPAVSTPTADAAPRTSEPAPSGEVQRARDTDQINAVLARFQSAYRSLDATAARAVWPTVDQRALGRAFSSLVSQDLTLNACNVDVNGAEAAAACTASNTFVARVGNREPRTVRYQWNFRLRKVGTTWTIAQADAK